MVRHPLAREVLIIVVVKTALVVAAALLVFGPKARPVVDDAVLQNHLLTDTGAVERFGD